jgi:hypothetical protein
LACLFIGMAPIDPIDPFAADSTKQIPGFAFFKLWTLIIYPFFVANKSSGPEEETQASSQSKRQQKLQARADRGDPRVRAANRS